MRDINIYKKFLNILIVVSITQVIINVISNSKLYDGFQSVVFFSIFLTVLYKGMKNEKYV